MAPVRNHQISFTDLQNPLFLNPTDGPNSNSPPAKLTGIANYRPWRHWMEINLSMKQKLGFINGTIAKPDDPAEAEQWEICNNAVISWIMNGVYDSISSYILYMHSASEIWKHLERRFSLSNGSRKYKLNKDIYELKQNNVNISEYFTRFRALWEEIDALNELPIISVVNTETTAFLKAFTKQKEEQKLFQFLNGLDLIYNAQRSQLLLMTPLPSVETACSVLQQEENQKEILCSYAHPMVESTALYSKNMSNETCPKCGNKGHPRERCWLVISYPHWHPKSAQFPQKRMQHNSQNSSRYHNSQPHWKVMVPGRLPPYLLVNTPLALNGFMKQNTIQMVP